MVASLSLATDLGLGLPQEHVLRQTVIADRLAEVAGMSDDERAAVRMISLLAWVGCVADSHELAHWFGDEVALRADSYAVDKSGWPMLRLMLGHLAPDSAMPWGRVRVLGSFLATGLRPTSTTFVTHCQTTGDIATRLGLPEDVRRGLSQVFERWDGHGVPERRRGEAIDRTTRVVQLADDLEVADRRGGDGPAMLRQRRGTEFDPALVDLAIAHADLLLADLDNPWEQLLRSPLAGDRVLDDVDDALTVIADYADLKSPWWLGHSRAVAELAGRAAAGTGADPVLVRRAALVHRLGAVGVSAHVWAKPGALGPAERDRVRQVPFLTARVLERVPELAVVGRIAGQVRERLDGSGYPAGLTADRLGAESRLLAAAQTYRALLEDRPHRAASTPDEAARRTLEQVTAGRLDADAVRAVLQAAGQPVPRRISRIASLTERECEVLALLARGRSLREIAGTLTISQHTAGSHVEHIYTKIGVSTRGAAAMFAMRNGIV